MKRFITICSGVSGFFPVMFGYSTDIEDYEPIEKGFGRFQTYEEAIPEAKAWALDEECELRLRPEF